ncbi:unnamed protein product [Arctia plantaginis]|uniref:Ubiquinone biosynthesis O-methyltransferase, mitochondrial n=1 Tax=Arctia plantaginis TaxID=874455 RepID=A0A8S1AXZ1_ARCPL|nr:unnamed protein product [Arctia plantaginis]
MSRTFGDRTMHVNSQASKNSQRNLLCSSRSIQRNNERHSHSTIDTVEVEVFSKHMSDWWNPDGKLALLHGFNALRVPLIRDGLVQCATEERKLQPLKNIKILDVGCGGGILSEALARLGATITGIDASEDLIKIADEHKNIDPKIAKCKPTYIHTTVEDHVNKFACCYNCVVASEVIEHVNNQDLFVKSCVRALVPGGKIFFTTPNRTRLSQLVVILLAERMLKMVPDGAHEYEKFVTPTELSFMLEKNNCHVESTYGIQYNPLTKKWSFSTYQHLMYAMQAQKLS